MVLKLLVEFVSLSFPFVGESKYIYKKAYSHCVEINSIYFLLGKIKFFLHRNMNYVIISINIVDGYLNKKYSKFI